MEFELIQFCTLAKKRHLKNCITYNTFGPFQQTIKDHALSHLQESNWWGKKRNRLAFEAANDNYNRAKLITLMPNTQAYDKLKEFQNHVNYWADK